MPALVDDAIARAEPARGGAPDPALFALTGLEALRAFPDGRAPAPPIGRLCGLTVDSVLHGEAVFSLPVTDWLLAPHGLVSGATLMLLADGPLGCAAQTRLPPATPYTSADISLAFFRPVTREATVLVGRGRAEHVGRSMAFSTVRLEDGAGKLVALGSSRLAVFAPVAVPPAAAALARTLPPLPRADDEQPDPYLRPARGAVLGQEVFDRLSGLEVLRAQLAGDLPAPPIAHLTGLQPVAAGPDASTWSMPASPWMCSPVPDRLYGGCIGHLAGFAVEGTLECLRAPGTAIATVDLRVYFLRPVSPDGRELTAHGAIVHRGRSQAVASAEVFDADKRRVATAMGSALLLPDRTADLGASATLTSPSIRNP